MPTYKGIEYLRRKLVQKRPRIDLRYRYYDMKYLVKDLNISTPPDLRAWMSTLGWCGTAVDSLADRLMFEGFRNDAFGMAEVFKANNQDVMLDAGILGALISACDFIYITADETGFPVMRTVDGRKATGVIDPITNMLTEGYAILEEDEYSRPTIEAHLMPFRTDIYEAGGFIRSYKHSAPYPLLVPMIFRPDATRPFGHSRIKRSMMNIVQSAVRTIKRSEISAEFYSFPQKYVTGLSPDNEMMDKWKATISSMLQFTKDEDGDHPILGQFTTQSVTPHMEQLKIYASLFAGETGLTLDDLGFVSENPSSSEAIRAAHENLRVTGRKAQRNFGVGLLNVGYLAACLRDGFPYERKQFYETTARWCPLFEPDASQISGIGDAVNKIQQSFPDYFTEDKLHDMTGI